MVIMNRYKITIQRICICDYYIDANTIEEAKYQAMDEAENDDWACEQAVYWPLYAQQTNLPF